jgi:hypothetical protein
MTSTSPPAAGPRIRTQWFWIAFIGLGGYFLAQYGAGSLLIQVPVVLGLAVSGAVVLGRGLVRLGLSRLIAWPLALTVALAFAWVFRPMPQSISNVHLYVNYASEWSYTDQDGNVARGLEPNLPLRKTFTRAEDEHGLVLGLSNMNRRPIEGALLHLTTPPDVAVRITEGDHQWTRQYPHIYSLAFGRIPNWRAYHSAQQLWLKFPSQGIYRFTYYIAAEELDTRPSEFTIVVQ